jgi:hypothetical protein
MSDKKEEVVLLSDAQLELIRKSIREDAQLTGLNWDDGLPGQYCVVGGLIQHGGRNLREELPATENHPTEDGKALYSSSSGVADIGDDLWNWFRLYYGLEQAEVYDLQRINDYYAETGPRRAALLNYVEQINENRQAVKGWNKTLDGFGVWSNTGLYPFPVTPSDS